MSHVSLRLKAPRLASWPLSGHVSNIFRNIAALFNYWRFNSILTVIICTSPLVARYIWYHGDDVHRKLEAKSPE